jgi:putative ABC transport system substrate-binding protein
VRRREFITLLGGAAATRPLAARAQRAEMPVLGYLSLGSRESDSYRLTGLRQGLNETGYIEGRNLAVEYRWAENQVDRLPALALQLAQMRVAVIITPGLASTLPAKVATNNIPILFVVGADPVRIGLVASLKTDQEAISRDSTHSTAS